MDIQGVPLPAGAEEMNDDSAERATLSDVSAPRRTGTRPLRTGPRLVRATRAYGVENVWRSRWLFAQTIALVAILHVGIFMGPMWLKIPLSLLCGVVYIRLFIFYHDFLHGAQLSSCPVSRVFLHGIGYLMLSTASVWQETHDYHHRRNARVVGSGIGSFPVVTLKLWCRMSPKQRRTYLRIRHPLTIFFGYLTVFMIGMSIAPFRRNPRRHWSAFAALFVHWGVAALIAVFFGVMQALFTVILPVAVATALGSYLFYAQHNFPDVQYFERRSWRFDAAAMHSSSMFDMPRWAHWLTGNIGYHHIHHLNHRIPFYRLPEAYAEVPELRRPGRTSWRPSDMRACLSLAVWDETQGRMLTYKELRRRAPETFA